MLSKKLRELTKRRDNLEWLRNTHHNLMKEYGWIPFEEFKQLPLSTLYNLIEEINIQRKGDAEDLKKTRRK